MVGPPDVFFICFFLYYHDFPASTHTVLMYVHLQHPESIANRITLTFRAMMEVYCTRAELEDGMSIVDLGCGWGSLSIFMAQKYPNSKITSISNSKSQKMFIDGRCKELGITNINVITGDINVYDLPNHGVYDRVCSIEMFEVRDRKTLLFTVQQ